MNTTENHTNAIQTEENLPECRVCLQTFSAEAVLYNLFEEWPAPWDYMQSTKAEDLAKLANIQLSISDKYSKVICELCCNRLQNACDFVSLAQKNDTIIRQRYRNEIKLESEWPKPIQLDKNINSMDVEIKQEVLSDAEYDTNETEEAYRPEIPNLDIKIEPEEITESNPIQVTVNGTISAAQFDENKTSISLNGNETYEDETYLDASVKEEPTSDIEDNNESSNDLPLDCLLCTKTFNSISGLKVSRAMDTSSKKNLVETNVNANCEEEKIKRIRQRDCCYYCENRVLNFARHVFRNHKLEPEVQKALSAPRKSKCRKTILTELRKKGNYILNAENCLKPVKKGRFSNNSDYLPCPNCLGFYLRKQLWKHIKKCDNKSLTFNVQVQAQNFLLRHLKVDQKLKDEVFPRMRPDKISLEAKRDTLICAFGAQYLREHREQHSISVISRRMRELAKLLISIKKSKPDVKSLIDVLRPQFYDVIVLATKNVAHYDNCKDPYVSPTYAMNIATSIKQCCNIALMETYKIERRVEKLRADEIETDLKTLTMIMENRWKFDVSNIGGGDLRIPMESKDGEPLLNSSTSNNIIYINTEGTSLQHKRNISYEPTKKKRILVPWTLKQKEVVMMFFDKHIRNGKPPKRSECDTLKEKYSDLLKNKDWLKIKVFVQNVYTKKR